VLELCAEGRLLLAKRTPSCSFQALHCYERSVEIDPRCAEAWAGISECYTWTAAFGMDPVGGNFKAHSAARRAVELDEASPAAHLAYGFYHYAIGWDWEIAARELCRAVELSPDDPLAHERLVWILTARGRLDEAVLIARRAVDLNPLSASARTTYANAFYIGRRYPEAERAFRDCLGVDAGDPNFFFIHLALGMIFLAERRYPEAVQSFSLAVEMTMRAPPILGCYALACGLSGNRAEAGRVLAEMRALTSAAPVPPVALALIHAGLGEVDHAFDSLRHACEIHSPLFHWATYPLFDVLRADPRLAALLRNVGLPACPEDYRPLPAAV
jgi:serine/threonine-protein kinase